jgi:hypothetical protein
MRVCMYVRAILVRVTSRCSCTAQSHGKILCMYVRAYVCMHVCMYVRAILVRVTSRCSCKWAPADRVYACMYVCTYCMYAFVKKVSDSDVLVYTYACQHIHVFFTRMPRRTLWSKFLYALTHSVYIHAHTHIHVVHQPTHGNQPSSRRTRTVFLSLRLSVSF